MRASTAAASAAKASIKHVNPYRVPIFNCLYELLLDDPPTLQQINSILEAFAFLCSILMSMAAAVMTCIDHDQSMTLRGKVAEFRSERDIKLLSGQVIDPYFLFLQYSVVAFGCITSSIFILIIMWLLCGTISFNNSSGVHSKAAFKAWWNWARIPIIMLIVLMAAGIGLYVIAACYAFSMQHADSSQKLADLIYWTDAGHYAFLLCIGTLVPIIFLSTALSRRESVHVTLARELRLDDESAADVIMHFGREVGHTEEELLPLVDHVVNHHWLQTASDLISLDDESWKLLGLPLMLAARIKDELASEDFHIHKERRSRHKSIIEEAAAGAASLMG